MLQQISNDPEFQEFLALHKNRTLKPKWTDDAVAGSAKQDKVKDKKKKKSELVSKSTDSDAEDVDSDAQSDCKLFIKISSCLAGLKKVD